MVVGEGGAEKHAEQPGAEDADEHDRADSDGMQLAPLPRSFGLRDEDSRSPKRPQSAALLRRRRLHGDRQRLSVGELDEVTHADALELLRILDLDGDRMT